MAALLSASPPSAGKPRERAPAPRTILVPPDQGYARLGDWIVAAHAIPLRRDGGAKTWRIRIEALCESIPSATEITLVSYVVSTANGSRRGRNPEIRFIRALEPHPGGRNVALRPRFFRKAWDIPAFEERGDAKRVDLVARVRTRLPGGAEVRTHELRFRLAGSR